MKKLLLLLFILNSSYSFSQENILVLSKIQEEKFIMDGIVSDQEIENAKMLELIYEQEPGLNTV